MNRRDFIRDAGLAAASAWAMPRAGLFRMEGHCPTGSTCVAEVRLDLNNLHKWDDSNGDTWDPFWADDGRLYAFNCDGRGFGKEPRNLAFNVFSGTEFGELTGHQVNSMDEYGKAGEKLGDHATWKVCGQECIDSVFYAFVSRNIYGNESNDPLNRQRALNCSLIKSVDRGLHWTRSARENYERPMWPGAAFGAPFFVHYGQNGGNVEEDQAGEFVYTASTNGFWNDGDFVLLGRVPRSQISQLDAGRWQYFRGGSGLDDTNWTSSIYEASPILSRPAKCGQTPITYVPALRRYLLISWYNPEPMTDWFKPARMRYDFYAAEHPWGPWTQIGSLDDSFLAPGWNWYGPSLCAKYQESLSGEVTVRMFTSGCQFEDVPSGIYKVWEIPVLLRTVPALAGSALPLEGSGTTRQGNWTWRAADPGRNNAALVSSTPEDQISISFEGTGIEVVARKSSGYGALGIRVDDLSETTARLAIINMPELSGVSVYRNENLVRGKHKITLRNAGGGPVNVQGIRSLY
jgi:hypothetical protein